MLWHTTHSIPKKAHFLLRCLLQIQSSSPERSAAQSDVNPIYRAVRAISTNGHADEEQSRCFFWFSLVKSDDVRTNSAACLTAFPSLLLRAPRAATQLLSRTLRRCVTPHLTGQKKQGWTSGVFFSFSLLRHIDPRRKKGIPVICLNRFTGL